MSDTTTPTGADSVEKIAHELRRASVSSVPSELANFENLNGWADRLAALSSVADGVPRDDELPGMWERADLIGGATDCPAAPVGGDGEACECGCGRICCPSCGEEIATRPAAAGVGELRGVAAELRYADGMQGHRMKEWAQRIDDACDRLAAAPSPGAGGEGER